MNKPEDDIPPQLHRVFFSLYGLEALLHRNLSGISGLHSLVSGGSKGAVLYWDLSSPTAGTPTPIFSTSFPSPQPCLPPQHCTPHPQAQSRTTNPPTRNALPSAGLKRLGPDIPLGHLISASNDHTTLFWVCKHPGDATSIFVPQPLMTTQMAINMVRMTCSLYPALVGPAPPRCRYAFTLPLNPSVRVTMLPNKIRVAMENTPGHFSRIGLYVNAGAQYETPSSSGVSHFLDRMAFKVCLH
jgi:Insulinase (Peptidase family M16)